jgi:hypothetical protein
MEQLSILPATASAGRVYYATDGWRIKIGFTTRSPRRRGGELAAQILWAEPGDLGIEALRHQQWRRYRIPGTEWFEASDELMLWLLLRMTGDGRTAALRAMEQLIVAHKSPRTLASAA